MLTLALETATDVVGVALADGELGLASSWTYARRRHAELLGPAVRQLCDQAGRSVSEIELVAVDRGPGLFTGLRVGVAMANGLAMSRQCPVLGFSSLEVLARGAAGSGWRGPVLAVVDARRAEVFAAPYRVDAGGAVSAAGDAVLAQPGDLADLVEQASATAGRARLLAIGDGALRYRHQLIDGGGASPTISSTSFPVPEVLAAMAVASPVSHHPAPGRPVEPLYLRSPDVKIGWVRRGTPS